MKLAVIRFSLLTLFSGVFYPLFSQSIDQWMSANESLPVDKIYLHTDREFYFLKETIWIKGYLLSGKTEKPSEGNENFFIDLVDEKGKVVLNSNLVTNNGEVAGYFYLNDTLAPGTYMLRAYTDYLRTFGEDAFFSKPLKVSEIMNSMEISEAGKNSNQPAYGIPDLSFLPEGGFLLAEVSNLVAVKAVDPTGKGVRISGIIRNEKGDSVATFRTGYKGMGAAYLYPQRGSTYHVELPDYPGYRYTFDDIREADIKLQVVLQNNEEVVAYLALNTEKFNDQDFYLVDMYRGIVQFYKQFQPGNRSRLFRINKGMFPGGINRLILLNGNFQPVSERLVFSDNYDLNQLEIKTDSVSYSTRSEVSLQLVSHDSIESGEFSNLSVAVVDENTINANGPSGDIRSWLLLDSELKGYVESPAGFFVDDSIPSGQKLDLLMLTNGWTNYFWNTLPPDSLRYSHTSGINLKGRVKKLIGQKPVENGEVSMLIFRKRDVEFLGSKTDEYGKFNFDKIFFYDTASVFLQTRNEKGKRFTEVFVDSVFEKSPVVSEHQLSHLKLFSDIPMEFYRRKYLNDLTMREFYPDSSSIMLGEVEVKRERRDKEDGHFRIYGDADNSLKVTDKDIGYVDVLSFLSGRVAGVMVSGNSVSIRGMGTPLFLIDGMPYEGDDGISMVQSIPMSDIDVVEVLKDVSNLAVFGVRGANGVIAIYTKRGEISAPRSYLIGAIAFKIIGYQPYKEFYSPKYIPENIDSPEPDFRSTLYWNPAIKTEDGKASLSFFTCDEVTNYKVFVEGISSTGRICLGTGKFLVDRFR